MCEQTSTEIKKYNVFTIANDKVNAGYSSTVKALASNYNHIKHISTDGATSEFDKRSLDEFIKNIKNNLPANILFAGGQNFCDRIRNIQKFLKEQLTEEEFNKISFTLNTERFNDSDNFDGIVNLTVITQENQEKCKEIMNNNTENIKFYTVDISACGNGKTMEESAKIFQEANQELFSNLPLEQIDTFFYLGGNGQGFTSKEGIDISKEYEDFIKTSFNMVNDNKPVVIFTHGFRTFHDLSKNEKPLNFEPIDKMYKTIEEQLNIDQECYVFSQKQNEENRSETHPVLIKFKKNKDNAVIKEEINIVNKGSLYNQSLLTVGKKNIKVVATQEQQNFPIEAITAGIPISQIDSIKWKLQAQNHELMYETVKEKGDNLITAENIYNNILVKEKDRTQLSNFTDSAKDFEGLIKPKIPLLPNNY